MGTGKQEAEAERQDGIALGRINFFTSKAGLGGHCLRRLHSHSRGLCHRLKDEGVVGIFHLGSRGKISRIKLRVQYSVDQLQARILFSPQKGDDAQLQCTSEGERVRSPLKDTAFLTMVCTN